MRNNVFDHYYLYTHFSSKVFNKMHKCIQFIQWIELKFSIVSILMPKILFQYRLLLPYIRILRLPHTPIGNNMSSHTLITPLEEKNGVGNTHLAAMKLRHF